MKKRKGSVLLQTLTICIILSYIAVSLTLWTMGRYTQGSNAYYRSAANLEGHAEVGTYLSTLDPAYKTGSINCINGSNNGSPNGFSYTVQCRTIGKTNLYVFKFNEGGKYQKNIFVK